MERILITKLVRTDETRADLYAKGHQWPDLKLFDLSELADVGIDFAGLPQGEEVPCRFWAIYELSDKLNKAGNPYRDIVALEAIDAPATSTSTDNTAVLSELRAIRALLQVLVKDSLPSSDMPSAPEPVTERIPEPEPARDDAADLDAIFPRENGKAPDNGDREPDANDGLFDSPATLLEILNQETGGFWQNEGHVLYALKQRLGSGYAWPVDRDADGWQQAHAEAVAYMKENLR